MCVWEHTREVVGMMIERYRKREREYPTWRFPLQEERFAIAIKEMAFGEGGEIVFYLVGEGYGNFCWIRILPSGYLLTE